MDKFEKLINKTIDGRYRIQNVVGVGGMAYVLRAEDLALKRTVAIKILNDEFRSDQEAVKRFVNESKAVSILDQENIVKIFDVAIHEDLKYIVMEYIDGITLKDYLNKKGALGWKEAIHYTLQILAGLEHAHDKGIIHRDVKPQNIMLLRDGKIKITDFGIAKLPNNEPITMTDKAIGTVNYISPEQASGGKVDAYSDIYSVGVMLYEMVCGRLPFVADSPVAVAMMQVSHEPTAPRELMPDIPIGLEQIILKAMSKTPDDRFSSAGAMIKALEYFKANPNIIFTEKPHERSDPKTAAPSPADTAVKTGKKRSGRSMLPIISGVTLAFFIVAIASVVILVTKVFNVDADDIHSNGSDYNFSFLDKILAGGETEAGHEIIVPDLTGQIYDDALKEQLLQQNFRVLNVKYITFDELPKNQIVKQDPEPNAVRMLNANAKYYDLSITVNKGADEIEMPDLTLTAFNSAKTDLTNLGFNRLNIIREDEFSDTVTEGFVIRTEPAPDELVDVAKNTKITLYVSKGQKVKTTTVPLVAQLSVDDAKKAILNSNLSLGSVTYVISDLPVGTVVKASKDAYTVVPEKITKIDLFVSAGNGMPVPQPKNDAEQDDDLDPSHPSADAEGGQQEQGEPDRQAITPDDIGAGTVSEPIQGNQDGVTGQDGTPEEQPQPVVPPSGPSRENPSGEDPAGEDPAGQRSENTHNADVDGASDHGLDLAP